MTGPNFNVKVSFIINLVDVHSKIIDGFSIKRAYSFVYFGCVNDRQCCHSRDHQELDNSLHLHRQHLHLNYIGRSIQKLIDIGEQRLSHLPLQMRIQTCLGGEEVDDPEYKSSWELDGVPHGCLRFRFDQRKRTLQCSSN